MDRIRSVQRDQVVGGLVGAAVGDALGVPVEFRSREALERDPVTGMRGYGTHRQPPGTWSDDTSLMLCTAESLLARGGFDPADMGARFVRWMREAHWTPWGTVFDIGGTTRAAISRLARGGDPLLAGGAAESDNGNGSLMRILPIALWFAGAPTGELLERAHQASCLTHRHPRSQLACGIYCLTAAAIVRGLDPPSACQHATQEALAHYQGDPWSAEIPHFQRVLSGEIASVPQASVRSGGYVVETLEASIWCVLHSGSFAEAVLKAVNLGGDTDTTATVTGGLAGIHYGVHAIPGEWRAQLARSDEVCRLATHFAAKDPDALPPN